MRAVDRRAELFVHGLKETRRSLVRLQKAGETLRRGDFQAETNTWLDQHLTPVGRRTMLTALRQERAGSRRDGTPRSVRLSAKAHASLSELADKHGLSLPETVSRLVAAAGSLSADRWLQDNWDALDSSNRFVDEHGVPLEKHRQF